MHKIDTSGWGEFRLGDLWDVQNTWVYGKNKKWVETEILNSESIPVISGITDNNGVYYWTNDITLKSECFEDCLTITTRGEYSGTLKYHKGKFVLANNILAMPMPNLSEYACKFLIVVINALGMVDSNYPTKNTLENDIIKLPIDSKGNPDWQYMENYMRNIEVRVSDSISKLESAKDIESSKIDVGGWGEFVVSDVCCVLKGRKKLSNINITDLGSTPVYSSTTENNGIIGYTEESPDYVIDTDTSFYIIFGDHTKSMYIATNDFCVMDNVKVLVPKVYNKYAMQFVLASWQKSIPTLGYSRHWSVAEKAIFKLPTDTQGEPDWLYMENYMRNIEVRVSTSISKLESVLYSSEVSDLENSVSVILKGGE